MTKAGSSSQPFKSKHKLKAAQIWIRMHISKWMKKQNFLKSHEMPPTKKCE